MTDSELTAIQLVIDRSGSMGEIRSDAEGAINAFIDDQREQPGRCLLRLTHFDDIIEVAIPLTDIDKVEQPYRLNPRGMTALYDAIGTSIVSFGDLLEKMDEDDRPAHVLFVIVTDGFENRSREYKDVTILKEMIEKQHDQYSWEFVYLAANQDAVLVSRDFGIRPDSALSFSHTGGGTRSAMSSASYYASGIRSGVTGQSFSDEDRRSATEDD
jgi:uncharacterized protein YegL